MLYTRSLPPPCFSRVVQHRRKSKAGDKRLRQLLHRFSVSHSTRKYTERPSDAWPTRNTVTSACSTTVDCSSKDGVTSFGSTRCACAARICGHHSVLVVRSFSARRMCDMDTFQASDWFDWPWYRQWPWRWWSTWGMNCTLGKFQPVTGSQVAEIETVLKSR